MNMKISGTGLKEMNSKEFYQGKVNVDREIEGEDGESTEQKEELSGLELKDEIRKLILEKGYQFSEDQLEKALKDLGLEGSQYYKRKDIMQNVLDYFEKRKK